MRSRSTNFCTVPVAVSGKPSFLVRSGTAALLAELRDDGTTHLSDYPGAAFSGAFSPPHNT